MKNKLSPPEFSTVTGRTLDIIRNLAKRKLSPWEDTTYGSGAHRWYDGSHVLAMTVLEFLTAQGLNTEQAGETIKFGARILKDFLDDVQSGREPIQRFVVSERRAVFDEFTDSFRWEAVFTGSGGTREEVMEAVQSALAAVGRSHTRSAPKGAGFQVRNIGGPHFAIASVDEAYRLAVIRAGTVGYELRGYDIAKKAGT